MSLAAWGAARRADPRQVSSRYTCNDGATQRHSNVVLPFGLGGADRHGFRRPSALSPRRPPRRRRHLPWTKLPRPSKLSHPLTTAHSLPLLLMQQLPSWNS